MDKESNSLNWFEIGVNDLPRAKKFYEQVFDMKMDEQNMMGMDMAFFPADSASGKASGALVKSDMHKPSQEGAVIYLNANPRMDPVIERITKAGGQIIMPKTEIGPEIGHMAFFIDSEGNRVALHSQN